MILYIIVLLLTKSTSYFSGERLGDFIKETEYFKVISCDYSNTIKSNRITLEVSLCFWSSIRYTYSFPKKYTLRFRIGTCGGIGLEPGTVVITEEAFDGQLRPLLDTVGHISLFIIQSHFTVVPYKKKNHELVHLQDPNN